MVKKPPIIWHCVIRTPDSAVPSLQLRVYFHPSLSHWSPGNRSTKPVPVPCSFQIESLDVRQWKKTVKRRKWSGHILPTLSFSLPQLGPQLQLKESSTNTSYQQTSSWVSPAETVSPASHRHRIDTITMSVFHIASSYPVAVQLLSSWANSVPSLFKGTWRSNVCSLNPSVYLGDIRL